MRASVTLALILFSVPASWAAPAVLRDSIVRSVDPASSVPTDLATPEGRTRWDLTKVASTARFRVRILDDYGDLVEERGGASRRFEGEGARAWLLPDAVSDDLRMGARKAIDFRSSGSDYRAEVETVGIGWVHLPAGPREVVLQRASILRRSPGSGGFAAERWIDRWVDPKAGVVAEASGPFSADGRSRLALDDAWLVDAVVAGAADLKIYVDELQNTIHENVFYGWDRGLKTQVSELTPEAFPTVGNLIAASTWDFSQTTIDSSKLLTGTTTANNTTTITGSGTQFQSEVQVGDRISLSPAPTTFARVTAISSNTSLTVDTPLGNGTTQNLRRRVREVSATVTPIDSTESCNSSRCGYTRPGSYLERRDVRFDSGVVKYNTAAEREDRPGDVTIWLRAGAQKEGVTGAFGTGESRFCYDPTFDATTRSPVPEWRFSNQDAGGWYMDAGDAWEGGPFNCEQNLFNQTCGAPQLFDRAWSKSCTGHSGKQTGEVLKGGVIVLPSGHTFNSLLVRTVADFCVYTDSFCFFKVQDVRTVVYLWQVPHLGSVARVQSVINAPDLTSWSEVEETDFKFGLFPPVAIQTTGQTDTTVSLSWDPGDDVRRIKDYRIYWDSDSGGATPYAFDSMNNPGQVSFAGTTATVSGLSPGTTYFFTVTSRSDFTDPSNSVTTTYESMVYPTQVSGDPNHVYPVEVSATTSGGVCIPQAAVQDLRVNENNGVIEFCWQPVSDPCLVGYDLIGAGSPESDGNFVLVGQTGLETCWSGTPAQVYYLVRARGTGGTGPWGHYGH